MHTTETAGEAIASRPDQAFATMVTETAPHLSALARRLVGNEHDAADVVQESYLRAWRSLDRFRGDARASTWLHAIVTNTARSFLRQRLRARTEPAGAGILAHPDPHPDADPAARADTTASLAEVTGVIAGLPASLRSVLLLKDLHGLSHDAVALGLGITPTASKVRLHRARRRLRADLGPRLPGSRVTSQPVSPDDARRPGALAALPHTRRTAS